MEKYYRVTNVGLEPVLRVWTSALLSEEDKADYDKYIESDEYLGASKEEKNARMSVPQAIKSKPFYMRLSKGVLADVYEPRPDGTTQIRPEYHFCIGPDYKQLAKENQIYITRNLCERHGIAVGAEDTAEVLVERLREKFGASVVVLTHTQVYDSGLSGLTKKAIKQKLQPGESKAQIVYEGFLDVQEILPGDVLKEQKQEEVSVVDDLESKSAPERRQLAKQMGLKYVGQTDDQVLKSLRAYLASQK